MNIVPAKYMVELTPPAFPITPGMRGLDVKRVQEWLTLAGNVCECDGDWGPATTRAVKEYRKFTPGQAEPNQDPPAEVDAKVWASLSAPLVKANAILNDGKLNFGELVCAIARRYLAERAREVGGDNRGVWQRHVSRGRENQPWCQDAVSTWWFDAARALGMTKLPFDLVSDEGIISSYVPWVAASAQKAGKLQRSDDPTPLKPGSMFFLKSGSSYSHVGVVTRDNGDSVDTIEGNTNAGGSPNGYEVAARHRNRLTCDYGRI